MRRPSPAMLVALLALAVALGGTASAAKLITSRDIGTHAVTARTIAPGAITRAKLAPALRSVATQSAGGLAGQAGPAGPQGAQGAAGQGARVYQVFATGVWVQPGASRSLDAECRLGDPNPGVNPDEILSGGYTVTDAPGVRVTVDKPYVHEHPGRDGHNDSWAVAIFNGSGIPVYLDVNGICLSK